MEKCFYRDMVHSYSKIFVIPKPQRLLEVFSGDKKKAFHSGIDACLGGNTNIKLILFKYQPVHTLTTKDGGMCKNTPKMRIPSAF